MGTSRELDTAFQDSALFIPMEVAHHAPYIKRGFQAFLGFELLTHTVEHIHQR